MKQLPFRFSASFASLGILLLQACTVKSDLHVHGPYSCERGAQLTVTEESTFNRGAGMITDSTLEFKLNDTLVAKPPWFKNDEPELYIKVYNIDRSLLTRDAKELQALSGTGVMSLIAVVDVSTTDTFVKCFHANMSQFFIDRERFLREEFNLDGLGDQVGDIKLLAPEAKLVIPPARKESASFLEWLNGILQIFAVVVM